MFAVIYHFEIKPGKENRFIEAWKNLTQLIYKHEGSLGSRLHKKKDHLYIAYAQWPNKVTWENSGSNLPPEANVYRQNMKDVCVSISTQHELQTVEDLLAQKPF